MKIQVRALFAMLIVMIAAFVVAVKPAQAVGSYDNALVADIALRYVGKHGSQACADAGKADGDECKQFANCVIYLASSRTQWAVDPGGNYQNSYPYAGGTEVSTQAAAKGDVIQRGYWDSDGRQNNLHTAIVLENLGGGSFKVVDSNYARDGVVRVHNYTPPSWARFWRMGTVRVQAQPALPPKDSDGDGMPDNSDQCPTASGVGYNFGCAPPRQRLIADFDSDGASDIAAFYRYDDRAALWLWYGNRQRGFYPLSERWEETNGWVPGRIIPAGAGDFNGDGKADIAAFYRYDNAGLALWVWYGDGRGGFVELKQAWYAPRDWYGERTIPAGAADFNKDGRADIAAFYRYDGAALSLNVWKGKSDGAFTEPGRPWSATRDWYGERVIPIGAGDINGDGLQDVAALYRHDHSAISAMVWYGDGDAGVSVLQTAWWSGWSAGWWGERVLPAGLADFNGDGRDDVAVFYRYDNAMSAMYMWQGRRDGYVNLLSYRWLATRDWFGDRIIPAGAGDVDGDGRADVTAYYRDNDAGGLSAHTWFGDGASSFAELRRTWTVPSGWEGRHLIP